MNKIISFFKEGSPFKLLLITVIISLVSYFIQKPLPNIFMGLRLIAFILFVFAIMRLLNKK